MLALLDSAELIGAALEAAGVEAEVGADASWRGPLEALVDSLNGEARLNEMGAAMLSAQITRPLANRFAVDDFIAQRPDVADQPVEAPTFIVGLPRTGTTLLSYLLDCDPANRSLRRWESMDAVPPPEPDATDDPRIPAAAAEMDALYDVRPEFKGIHYESAEGPTECVVVLAGELRSIHYETLANIPSYGRLMEAADHRPAYEHHRRTLQVLSQRHRGRWILKSPVHLLTIDALLDAYPDARFIQTHRDPARVVVSVASLVSVLSGIGTDHDFRRYQGDRWLHVIDEMLMRGAEQRAALGPTRWYDIRYDQMVADPVGEAARLYDWLGWDLPVAVEAGMAEYSAARPQHHFGTHEYRAKDFGLKPRKLGSHYEQYRQVFGIPEEPPR